MATHTEPYRLDFQIPPDPPAEVAAAEANFRRLVGDYRDLVAQLHEAPASRDREIGEARAAAATARVEKSKPPTRTQDKVATEWSAKIAALEEDVATAAEAVRQAYEVLVRAIDAAKDEWVAALIAEDKVETLKLIATIEAVEDQLDRLSHVRSAPFWLSEFVLQHALIHSQSPYPGGAMRASFGNLYQIANPPMNLAGYRGGQPFFTREYGGETHYVWADGSELEPEDQAYLKSGRIA